MPLLGVPMIFRQIERMARCKNIDRIVVATSSQRSDDALAAECRDRSIEVFRGSLSDVLSRFYTVASTYSAEHIVRMTADCPLADPALVDRIVDLCISGQFDYYSNVMPPTFPNGLDVEVFSYKTLASINSLATSDFDREHVTSFLRLRPEGYRWGNFRNEIDINDLRLTVDTVEDYIFVTRIFESLYPVNSQFSLSDVLTYIKNCRSLRSY